MESASRSGCRSRIRATNRRALALARFIPVQIKRRGAEMRMVLERDNTRSAVNLPLLEGGLARAGDGQTS
jgi:hypothetical protein